MSTTMGGQMGNSTSATLRWMWRFGVSASVTLVVLGIGWQIASPSIVLRVSGHPGWWLVGAAAVFGGILAALWVMNRNRVRRDLQQRAELDAAVAAARTRAQEAADQDRTRLLSRLDHELKNPLTALRISLSSAALQDPETLEDSLTAALNQTERLGRLIGDLRKLADVRTRELDLEMVDISVLLKEVYQLIEESDPQRAAARQWSIHLPTVPWPVPEITADAGLVFLAVHNLAENAVKYSRPGDRIELQAVEERGGVMIEVADTGLGIAEDDHVLVWEELGRAHSTARSVPGSGLGLAMVSAVAHRHGGAVTLRSRLEEGTAIRLWLPGHQSVAT